MDERNYEVFYTEGSMPVKAWTRGVSVEDGAREQLAKVARLPFIHKWIAVMPDVHVGKGATVGSVIPTRGAVIPAAVGVDIGCGMIATRTTLEARHLPDDLKSLRLAIEAAVPHGRTDNGGANDRGAWRDLPEPVTGAWESLREGYDFIAAKHPKIARGVSAQHLGTLGTGNHFIELCLDESDRVWFMLHSGSRGVGNRIGSYFIERAREEMERWFIRVPDDTLGYLAEGSTHFDDYVRAVGWAQDYAAKNREIMMRAAVGAVRATGLVPEFAASVEAVNCHHNYVSRERHYGKDVWVTRKGAVRAREGELGIIPGSMGARSFIVRGRGNPESFDSCSHGAGRAMTRTKARATFTVEDHARATEGIECRKDEDVVDETPMAYKPIEDVMHAQRDLVDVVHTLRQVVCVKG